jgi:hypothetical protein
MFKKKKVRSLLIVIAVVCSFFLLLNTILESIVKSSINAELVSMSIESGYILGIDDVNLNVFRGNISISGFYAKPQETLFKAFAKGETNRDLLKQLSVSEASLSGLGLYNLIVNRELMIDKINIDALNFNFYRPEKQYQLKALEEDQKIRLSLDSIHIPGIEKIDLTKMHVADYGFHVIDASTMDTISEYNGKELLFLGLNMNEIPWNKGYFTFDFSELELQLKQQEFKLQDEQYAVSFDDLHYRYYDQEAKLINFELKPILNREESHPGLNLIGKRIEGSVDTITISGIDSGPLFKSGTISIQNIHINGLDGSFLRDKTVPLDLDEIINLPQKDLESLRPPLYVNSVTIDNSRFLYSEKLVDTEEHVKVNLENIKGEINNITSIRDSIINNKSLDIKLSSDILNILPASVHISMPYNTANSSFYVYGFTKGTADFLNLNPVIYPVIGIKFEDGILDGVNFNFTGNSIKATGELTMLYRDLELEIYRKDKSENKKISWVANTFIKKSNPSKRGRTVVAKIDFKRVKYKEFDNYLWKSIQSGIVNSLIPFGDRDKKQ